MSITDAKIGEFVSSISVRVLKSFDYCHFEVTLGLQENGVIYPLSRADDLRKEAARLADKAVEQYKLKKRSIGKLEEAEYIIENTREEAAAIIAIAETDRTPEQQATLKAFKDAVYEVEHSYDYEDSFGA